MDRLDKVDFEMMIALEFVTFHDLELASCLDDRTLWRHCQQERWTLFTENRNPDGPDSLYATLADSSQVGRLPVLTIGSKDTFEHNRDYAQRVATDVAALLFGMRLGPWALSTRQQPCAPRLLQG